MIDSLKPDVVLMDLMMPILNGIEATAKLRSKGINIVIIALSQNQNPFIIDAIMNAGANAYFAKDVQTEQLIMTIKKTKVKPPDRLR